MKYTELETLQKLPLDRKIETAKDIIRQALEVSQKPVIAFSGGKDSLVLLHLVLEQCPEIAVIYGDTGVEFPECRSYTFDLAKKWGFDLHIAKPEKTARPGYRYAAQKRIWQELIDRKEIGKVLKPDLKLKCTDALERACPADLLPEIEDQVWPAGTRKGYWWCADQYGFPLLGKSWSLLDARRINIDTFLRFSQSISGNPKLLEYYRVLEKVKISQHCCTELKKIPAEKVQAELGADLIFKGLLASESRSRMQNFLSRWFLFQGKKLKRLHGRRIWHCQPLAIWTDTDIWEYIHTHNLPYSSLYDMEYIDEKGKKRKIARNGCMFCATDFKFKSNHLYALRQTHPKAWRTIMSRGMGVEILKLQNIFNVRKKQDSLWGDFGIDTLIDNAPCVFDTL